MLSLLLYLACAVFDPHQAELDRIVKLHKDMGHPTLSAYGIDVDEHGKIQKYSYIFIFHSPAKLIVSGDVVTASGVRVKIITMPEGIEPPDKAKNGVKSKP